MKEENAPSLRDPQVLFLSFFGVGFAPKAPGTFGTLATMPFLYLLGELSPPTFWLFIPFILILTLISCFIADITQRKLNLHDPQWIVIDEVIGMFIAWLFVLNNHWFSLIVIFGLFRFFDIIKFWPASYFDKKMEHGAGTILDDVVSGIFAGLAYLALEAVAEHFHLFA